MADLRALSATGIPEIGRPSAVHGGARDLQQSGLQSW
jgi:hypothetical protein